MGAITPIAAAIDHGAAMLARMHVPSGAVDAADVRVMHRLTAPDDAAVAWANLLSDHGATDMWVQLARGLEPRLGPESASMARGLLREVRDAGRAVRGLANERFARPRPFERDPSIRTYVHRPTSTSFPSGHAIGNYASGRVLASIDPGNAGTYEWLARQGATARVVGGVHHPTDVEAGARLGSTIAGDLLASHGVTPAPTMPTEALLGSRAARSFGHDAAAVDRVVALMPADVRAASSAAGDDAARLGWFEQRPLDNALEF